ncbi:FMN-dependent NADH-azoreductase [Paraflavitalea soli]|uniref:FMN dependent NADH:quinone oxidoreductase n=1 Tax=Paraflavitalea soli TaxID=2315862 RepID=A0A3B7MMI6_9BACT|nr:NAD(P)H-dependent oxidoreductase [Paraflavitalea soli]AXY75338.1 FMN-dependent NADH-azoreductase [Paraflavitalea soli]
MKNILHVTSSPRGEHSHSIRLANRIIDRLTARYPGSNVHINDTVAKNYIHLNAIHPVAYKTPESEHSPEQKETLYSSDLAVKELIQADIIVISIALYNFNIPSALKAWIDHVVRAGKTFSYQSGQAEGLLKGKKVYLAIASNGVYSDGPMKPYDFGEPYLRFILSFMGLTDITTYRVEGAGIPGIMETALEKGLESVAV